MDNTTLNLSLQDALFAPLLELVAACSNTRQCPDLSDAQFLIICLLRTLAPQESGRDFLQGLRDIHQVDNVERSQFFETTDAREGFGSIDYRKSSKLES